MILVNQHVCFTYKFLKILKSSFSIYGDKEIRIVCLTSFNESPIAANTCEGFDELHADPVDKAIIGANFLTKISLLIPIN